MPSCRWIKGENADTEKGRSLAKNKREFVVEGTPDVVLEIVWDFFESNKWPYPMKLDRSFLYEDRRPSSS